MPAMAVTKSAKAGRQKTARKLQGARSTRAPSPAEKRSKPSARQVLVRKTSGVRQTQAERRQKAEQAILMAVLQIIAERGLDELTLAEAGERAGYSRALPAHYFESKEVALVALCSFVVKRYFQGMQRHAAGREGLEGLLDRIRYSFDDAPKDPQTLRAFHTILGAAHGKPELAKSFAKLISESRAAFAGFISAGIARGEIRSGATPEVEAIWILAGLMGVMNHWLNDAQGTPLNKVGEAFIGSVRRALEA